VSTFVGILVFLLAALYDLINARYIAAVADRRTASAVTWSLCLGALGACGLLGVLEVGTWVIVPQILGYGAGTWLGVRGRP
jgi:hypothetical protein